ncbi:DeoR family transcriptional regulator [Orbus hercynius]|uniref:DeoR family transcriptional regulator n=1 Tax=Orbus hercynius TaxID=593135 RepID=A0A495RBT7_9GAMM|nr:DeoR/GlpR family DNA-binding transcription regulator [Orbus hercynius]RKS84791.1 DeoR family transcriptional regulator [Orbus hercynius]
MNSLERRNKIIELAQKTGSVLVNDLSTSFDVSEVTIRTDLRLLEKQGLLLRFHGGATLHHYDHDEKNTNELKLEDRYQRFIDPKKRIALAAAKYVKPGDTIILDSGSTTMMLAEELVKVDNITIITNNLPAAFVLSDNSNIMLAVCGGTLRHKTRSLHGTIAEQSLIGISSNYLFVGADGIDAERGITTFNEGYAISQFMANAAQTVVALLDSSKFGKRGFNVVLPIEQLDTIITDTGVDAHDANDFISKGINFITV